MTLMTARHCQGGQWFFRDMPASAASVGLVRRELTDWLAKIGQSALIDSAALVVSELTTNVVRLELSPTFRVHVINLQKRDGIQISVWDKSLRKPEPRQAGWEDESGRGLAIVECLSESWGVDFPELGGGKVVWVILRG